MIKLKTESLHIKRSKHLHHIANTQQTLHMQKTLAPHFPSNIKYIAPTNKLKTERTIFS